MAKKLRVSISYLSQLAAGTSSLSPERGVEIEFATNGSVTRKDLFPDRWRKIWPELAEKEES